MDILTNWIFENLGVAPNVQGKIAITVAVIVVLWIARRLLLSIVYKRVDELKARYNWSKISIYVTYLIGFLLIGRVWFEGIDSIATYFGLLSAGLAIALKDPIANIAGWLFILWRRPFELGDRIQIGDHSGDVIDQRLFQFTLLEIGNWVDADQSTGRIIHVPNGKIFTEDQANYTKAFTYIWDEIAVLVTFESNWKKAKEILRKIVTDQDDLEETARVKLRKASSQYMIFYNKLTPTVYTTVRDSGVLLSVRFLCEPRKRRMRSEKIWEATLDAFAREADIELAYPTQRIYRLGEGRDENTPSGLM